MKFRSSRPGNWSSTKGNLLDALWGSDVSYYTLAHETSSEFQANRHLRVLGDLIRSVQPQSILDCGCGEGTKLNTLVGSVCDGFGVDISSLAVQMAQRQYNQLNLSVADLEALPYSSNQFDVVTSFYTLEHTTFPETVLNEMVRVLRPGGLLVIAAPNFGSPLFPSPCSTETYKIRFMRRFWLAHLYMVRMPKGLAWERVQPKAMITGRYEMDWDATVEPYVHSLIHYLARRGLDCVHWSTDIDDIRLADSQMSCGQLFRRTGALIKHACLRAGQAGKQPYSFFGPNFFYAGAAHKVPSSDLSPEP